MKENKYIYLLYEPKHNIMKTEYDNYIKKYNRRKKTGLYTNDLNNIEKKFREFKENYNLPIITFEDKVTFMIRFYKYLENEERKEQIKTLKIKKEKLITKKIYNSKLNLWKILKKLK